MDPWKKSAALGKSDGERVGFNRFRVQAKMSAFATNKDRPSNWRRIGLNGQLTLATRKLLIHERKRKLVAAHRQLSQAETSKKLALATMTVVVTKEVDDEAVAFWQQGSLELNTHEAFEERFVLRTQPKLESALQLWWETALRTETAHTGNDLPSESPAVLHKIGYFLCLNPIYKALMDEYDLDEALVAIQEDWDKDVNGGPEEVERDTFCDSIFEV